EGALFAPWDGPAALMWTPTLAAAPPHCPPRGRCSRLGTARRRSCGPPRLRRRRRTAPRGGAVRALGRPGGAHVDPHACGCAAALPPEGALFAPWDGPAALMWTPTLAPAPPHCPPRGRCSRLGTARRRSCGPPRLRLRRC